jgi:hypothetical protein
LCSWKSNKAREEEFLRLQCVAIEEEARQVGRGIQKVEAVRHFQSPTLMLRSSRSKWRR